MADDNDDHEHLSPGLLVASPQMQDPFFSKTVVLLCRHEEDGAMGIVVNRETDLELETVLSEVKFELGDSKDKTVMWGGPVEPHRGTIVFRNEVPTEDDEFLEISGSVRVSGSMDVLQGLILAPDIDEDWFLSLGYAGWGPGQLDKEIREGSWIVLPLDSDAVFDLPVDDRYDRCIATLGIDANLIFMTPIDE